MHIKFFYDKSVPAVLYFKGLIKFQFLSIIRIPFPKLIKETVKKLTLSDSIPFSDCNKVVTVPFASYILRRIFGFYIKLSILTQQCCLFTTSLFFYKLTTHTASTLQINHQTDKQKLCIVSNNKQFFLLFFIQIWIIIKGMLVM